jgi:hypothetical protein
MVRKKIVAFIAVIFMLGAVTVAQSQENEDVTATCTVIGALTLTLDNNVDFGNVSATTAGTVYLDPTEQANTYCGATADAGEFTISGEASTGMTVTWPGSVVLSNGTDNLTYTLEVNGLDNDNQTGSSEITSPASITSSATGFYYLWVGGDVGQLATQPAGSYTNTATFTVEYN